MSSQKQRLEKIRKTHQALVSSEYALRGARNNAVLTAVATGAPVTHLAKAAGISRELIHRILRFSPEGIAHTNQTAGAAVASLATAQKSLDAVSAKRAHVEHQRADAIRDAVSRCTSTRAEVARFAGVSTETVRKTCLVSHQIDRQGLHRP